MWASRPEWPAEAVLPEAHVLLQNPILTIGQRADSLHFASHSGFGRFVGIILRRRRLAIGSTYKPPVAGRDVRIVL